MYAAPIVKDKFRLMNSCFAGFDGDGRVVGRIFWTLPETGTPFFISDLRIVPSMNSLELRWRNDELPCLPSYVIRTCNVGEQQACRQKLHRVDQNR